MLKLVLRVFLSLIILTLLAVGGLYLYNHDRTYYNDENEIGNTTGNLYNGGLFAEQDGQIYFSNDYADGALYVMNSDCTNIRRLSDDKAAYINVDENYIYYVNALDIKENAKKGFIPFKNSGVYRISQTGKGLKNYTGYPAAYLTLKGNNIYFDQYSTETGIDFYRYSIDESKNRMLFKTDIVPIQFTEEELLYVDTKDDQIKSMFLKSYTVNTVYEGSYKYPIIIDRYVYYMNPSDKNKLYRMNVDGSEETLLINNSCSTYNITNSGKYLYYQINEKKKKGIYRLNLETMKKEKIQSGNYKQIHVTDNYVFFKDYTNEHIYFLTADGDANISTFSAMLATE